jgi:pilus assembly protein CpaB
MNFRVLIPVALIFLGAGLYGLSGDILNQKDEPIEEIVIEDEPLISIWKAKSVLEPGQLVSIDDLSIVKVPESVANENGVVESVELELGKGAIAAQHIEIDQWVMAEHFLRPEQDGYISLTIAKNKVPFAINVDPDTIVGGVITHGSLVDVLALSSLTQNLANSETVQEYQTFTISPVLMAVKVIKIQKSEINNRTEVSLVLELSRKEIAKLVIAKKIAQLEVHKSIGKEEAEKLQANSGDVLPTYRAIKEYRAGKTIIK